MCDIVTYCRPSHADPCCYDIGVYCKECGVLIIEKSIDAGFVPMRQEKTFFQPEIDAHCKAVLESERLLAIMP